jgi:REP element-mobilizing transposase RayT
VFGGGVAVARALRIELPGAFYHVTGRGNARQPVFDDDRDCRLFLDTLKEAKEEHDLRILAYCLMRNHYHLVIGTPRGNLAVAMRQLNGVYTQRYNHRHQRVGHLFQGRYGATMVESGQYLLNVLRYVAMNPVKAGMASAPGAWRWDSHGMLSGPPTRGGLIDAGTLLDLLGGADAPEAMTRYRRFIEAGPEDGAERDLSFPRSGIYGSRRFIEGLRSAVRTAAGEKEFPRGERFAARPPLAELMPVVPAGRKGRAYRAGRDLAIYRAHRACGYSLSEIAKHLGMSCARVSRIASSVLKKKAKGKT